MFIGRKDELKQLETIYSRDHSNLIVLYGREGIGKTTFALKFSEGKDFVYHKLTECTLNEQLKNLDYVLSQVLENSDSKEKRILIIDEFHLSEGKEISNRILELVRNEDKYGRFLVMLLSSSINWVENCMVKFSPELARTITGIIKLKPFTFAEMVEWFPKLPAQDCIIIKAVLGGVPKYLNLWQENRRIRENLLSIFFDPASAMFNEAEHVLKMELRELSAYNTILASIASGRNKLNDIFTYTGFSRAKISVYLKNLTEMDIVEKIYSMNVKYSENTKKGLYRIKDNFINFYYAYVFPNISDVECQKGRIIYTDKVVPDFERYMREHFAEVCREYLELMSKYHKLPAKYQDWRTWYGKQGILDIIGQDGEGQMLVAMCHYSEMLTSVKELEEMKHLAELAGLRPQRYCIFSKAGFDRDAAIAAKSEKIITVSLSEL